MDGAKIATIEAQLRENKKLKIPPQGKQINTDKGGAVVMNNREKLKPTEPRTMVLTNSPPLRLVLGINKEMFSIRKKCLSERASSSGQMVL